MSLQPSFAYKTLAHVVGWSIFFFLPLLLSPHPEFTAYITDPGIITSVLLRNILLMGLFYLNLFYFTPKLLPKNGVSVFLFVIILSVLIISITNLYIHESLTEPFKGPHRQPHLPDHHFDLEHSGPPKPRIMLAGPFFSSLLITSMVATISTLIVMWNNWTQARENEQERTLQKVAAELSVLKLQISPHFLFNTLNNIRWLVRSKSDQAEEAVVKLSQLLRYILYQTNHDKVSLLQEVEHLQDFFSLQQIRLSNNDSVNFECNGVIENQMIVPLLFIPIAENFFKYGEFEGDSKNQFIITINASHLKLETSNKIIIQREREKESSGIGLANVKKRLALHYPDRYIIKYAEENGWFKLEMEIILS
jgi:sensor histidine kinase YesM